MQRHLLVGSTVAILLVAGAAVRLTTQSQDLPQEIENVLQLRDLATNRWVKYHEERPGTSSSKFKTMML
jgi:hypothetical protein